MTTPSIKLDRRYDRLSGTLLADRMANVRIESALQLSQTLPDDLWKPNLRSASGCRDSEIISGVVGVQQSMVLNRVCTQCHVNGDTCQGDNPTNMVEVDA
ncbi:hypothetical protein PAAG_12597 [Paracoccidioides lutzii Pb01]|uniref:Uncharacterized protein n=1 Tax=Paracoccidioides lutzii (strain ATCC MYA-826 / Pb01) TaxID=502779 RepID=A0A0A2UZS6_PARBA|nr:hypothetical protein PAAG_12597 [Paracoccidioides lutzii Pb01]KGQ00733.1 hypothetical protein PAAG_12597 [Paracoccidioides lutzii Pb01]